MLSIGFERPGFKMPGLTSLLLRRPALTRSGIKNKACAHKALCSEVKKVGLTRLGLRRLGLTRSGVKRKAWAHKGSNSQGSQGCGSGGWG